MGGSSVRPPHPLFASAEATCSRICDPNASTENRWALAMATAGSKRPRSGSLSTAANAAASPGGTSTPVLPSMIVSRAPPAAAATTGRPAACASTAVIPNSSMFGITSAAARGEQIGQLSIVESAKEFGVLAVQGSQALLVGSATDNLDPDSGQPCGLESKIDPLMAHQLADDEKEAFGLSADKPS